MPLILFIALLFLAPLSLSAQELLTITNIQGKSLQGHLIEETHDEGIVFEKKGGPKFTIKLKELTPTSQKLIQEQLELMKLASPHDQRKRDFNESLGIPIFHETSALWDEPVKTVAKRLRWKPDSSSNYQRTYRYLEKDKQQLYLTLPIHSATLVGENKGLTSFISLVFRDTPGNPNAALLERLMTQIFGPPLDVNIWQWKNHYLLLETYKDHAVRILIQPQPLKAEQLYVSRFNEAYYYIHKKAHFRRKKNGDTYLQYLPQQKKGLTKSEPYANLEKWLRHAGLPYDYQWHFLGATHFKKPSASLFESHLKDTFASLNRKGHRVKTFDLRRINLRNLARPIHLSQPILWQINPSSKLTEVLHQRTETRRSIRRNLLWEDYIKRISKEAKTHESLLRKTTSESHYVLIIGYNLKTHEIAISKDWGKKNAVQWLHVKEANAINLQKGWILEPLLKSR